MEVFNMEKDENFSWVQEPGGKVKRNVQGPLQRGVQEGVWSTLSGKTKCF